MYYVNIFNKGVGFDFFVMFVLEQVDMLYSIICYYVLVSNIDYMFLMSFYCLGIYYFIYYKNRLIKIFKKLLFIFFFIVMKVFFLCVVVFFLNQLNDEYYEYIFQYM